MTRDEPTAPPRPFWQDLALAFITAAAAPLAVQLGKALREHLAARRPAPKREDAP